MAGHAAGARKSGKRNVKKSSSRYLPSIRRSRKGIELWISWILLMSFALILSALMYDWIFGFTEDQADELERRTFEAEGCDAIGLLISDICQNTQTLYINVTNVKNLRVNKLVFRVFDIYDTPDTVTKTVTIRPGRTEQVQVLKQGWTSRVEIVPMTKKGDVEVLCTDKIIAYDSIESC